MGERVKWERERERGIINDVDGIGWRSGGKYIIGGGVEGVMGVVVWP